MKVTAALATAPNSPLTITELDLDDPRPGEVRVRMVASGICHTDAIVRDQWYPVPLPAVLGHEGAGVVDAVGPGVSGLMVGDKVLMSFNHCEHCANCRAGLVAYCTNMYEHCFGGRRPDGTTAFSKNGSPVTSHFFGQSSFSSYSNVAVASVVKVPQNSPLELLAPLGCGFQTGAGAVLNSLNPEAGSSFAVFGAGAVGLSALLAARIAGCTTIIAVDRNKDRLALARELGATHAIDAVGEDVKSRIREITGDGAEYALETTAVPNVVTTMTKSLAVHGHGAAVGGAALGTNADLAIGDLLPRGIRFSFVLQGDSVPAVFIPRLVELHEAGMFPFDQLVRTYPFDQINDAFEDSAAGVTIKPVVVY